MSRSARSRTPNRPTSRASGANCASDPEAELAELTAIYVDARRSTPELARQVAQQLMAKDALGAHARDELGISEAMTARPVQAALTSAATFAVGAALPLLMVFVAPTEALIWATSIVSLVGLAALGAMSARTRRSASVAGGGAGDVLGRLRHGGDSGGRRPVWRAGLARRAVDRACDFGFAAFVDDAAGDFVGDADAVEQRFAQLQRGFD